MEFDKIKMYSGLLGFWEEEYLTSLLKEVSRLGKSGDYEGSRNENKKSTLKTFDQKACLIKYQIFRYNH